MGAILIIVYIIAGYWATGRTIYANKILIGDMGSIFIRRACMGAILGWCLIPIAIIKIIIEKKNV